MTTESGNVHSHQPSSSFCSSSFSAPLFCTTNTPFAQPPPSPRRSSDPKIYSRTGLARQLLFHQTGWSSFWAGPALHAKSTAEFSFPPDMWLVIIIFLASLVEEDRIGSIVFCPCCCSVVVGFLSRCLPCLVLLFSSA
jgi:hypothetical protein